MNIRRAREIAFQVDINQGNHYSLDELRQAFHRLDRGQPEKGPLSMRSDRIAAEQIWNFVGKNFAESVHR